MPITLLKHRLSIRTTNERIEKYSENSSINSLKPMSYSYKVQSMDLQRKLIEWFLL